MLIKKTAPLLLVSCLSMLLFTSCSKQSRQSKKELESKEELRGKSLALVKQKKYEEAAEYLERFVSKFPEDQNISSAKLLLADLYFRQEKYPSSYTMYQHFHNSYPADEKAEFAAYRSVLSKFYQTLKTDCDQTITTETSQLCKGYLNNLNYKKYTKDVSDIFNTCQHKAINKEVYVYNFYLKQKKYEAANVRLKHLKKNFLPKKKDLEPRLLYLECKLAKGNKDKLLLKKNIQKLVSEYPRSQFTHMAEALVSKQALIL